MSCFIVVAETIDKIQWMIDSQDPSDAFGRRLLKLNCEAYNLRYDTKVACPRYVFKQPVQSGKASCLKAMQCWLYQCSEGDIPETELYKFIEQEANKLAMKIAMNTKEYEEAAWE